MLPSSMSPENTSVTRKDIQDLIDQKFTSVEIADWLHDEGFSPMEIRKVLSDLSSYDIPKT